MEVELKHIREVYASSIQSLERRRDTKMNQIKNNEHDMQKILHKLNNTQIDIQSQIDGIKNKLSSSDFEMIMTEYWKIIDKADVFIKKEVITEYKTTEFTI